MNAVVPLFLLAPLVIVPLGYRLLEVAAPGSRPPAVAIVATLPAAAFLVFAFRVEPGPAAGVMAVPWLAVTGSVAIVAAARRIAPLDVQMDRRFVADAAVAFLAIGAAFATFDRFGLRPLGFDSTVVLLTAVHFHYAGFALPVTGALAYGRRQSRWLAVAMGAICVGIPLTALGFLGLPVANWTGAILTASGGAAVGLATIRVASRLARKAATLLAIAAGLSLCVSMPLAILYATTTFVGLASPGLDLMARVHGGLNVLGFAVPAMIAWTIERRADADARGIAMSSAGQFRWWTGALATGLVIGFGVVIGGPLAGALVVAAAVVVAGRPHREAAVGGLLLGVGVVWLLLGVASGSSCSGGCVAPNLGPWFAAASAMGVIGAVLTMRAFPTVGLRSRS